MQRAKKPQKASQREEKKEGLKPLPKSTYFQLSNMGSEGRIIFSSKEDFDRFEAYLYLLNSIDSPRVANLFVNGREREIFSTARGEKLIGIGAYCFTPKEFHLLVTPIVDGGVAKFMQKLQTAYTMYFNHKYQRSGRLFHSAYRSIAADSHEALRFHFSRTHLNASKLFNEHWEDLEGNEILSLSVSAMNYRFSSAGEYRNAKSLITSPEYFPKYFSRIRNADAHLRAWREGKGERRSY